MARDCTAEPEEINEEEVNGLEEHDGEAEQNENEEADEKGGDPDQEEAA